MLRDENTSVPFSTKRSDIEVGVIVVSI
jgi:hypothetical protein